MRITLRDVYDAVQDLKTSVAAVSGAMQTHAAMPDHSGAAVQGADHENRIRKLEKVAWAALGIATIASASVPLILFVIERSSP